MITAFPEPDGTNRLIIDITIKDSGADTIDGRFPKTLVKE